MKYRTFIMIRNSVVAGLVLVGGFGLVKGCRAVGPEAAPPRMVVRTQAPVPAVGAPDAERPRPRPAAVTQAPPKAAADRQPLSELHREVLAMAKKPLSNGTSDGKGSKWRVKKGKLVVELRSDTAKGFKSWNRAKIDLDGDKQWDEAWDLKPGVPVKRRVAPADDESYTDTYDLKGETWVRRSK